MQSARGVWNERRGVPSSPPSALLLVAAFTLGMGVTYFGLARPLIREIAQVRQEVQFVGRDLALMSGLRDQWSAASEVTTAMAQANDQLKDAFQSMEAIKQLRIDLVAEANKVREARRAIHDLATGNRIDTTASDAITSAIASMMTERRAIEQARQIRKELADEMALLRDARRDVARMKDLVLDVTRQTAGIETARQTLGNLIGIKSDIIRSSHDIEFARKRTDTMLEIVQRLGSEGNATATALENLSKLESLRKKVNLEAKDLAGAVETLDLLTGFRVELASESRKIAGMRESLADIAKMADSTTHLIKAIEPIAKMHDLSQHSDANVRAAARAILERRKWAGESTLRPASDQQEIKE